MYKLVIKSILEHKCIYNSWIVNIPYTKVTNYRGPAHTRCRSTSPCLTIAFCAVSPFHFVICLSATNTLHCSHQLQKQHRLVTALLRLWLHLRAMQKDEETTDERNEIALGDHSFSAECDWCRRGSDGGFQEAAGLVRNAMRGDSYRGFGTEFKRSVCRGWKSANAYSAGIRADGRVFLKGRPEDSTPDQQELPDQLKRCAPLCTCDARRKTEHWYVFFV